MSTIPKFGARGWFPECLSGELVALPYVTLSIQEASKWFRILEAVTFEPTGTVTAEYSDPFTSETVVGTFTSKLVMPDIASDGADDWYINGHMAEGSSVEADALPYRVKTPVMRQCAIPQQVADYIRVIYFDSAFDYHIEICNSVFYLRKIGEDYRLYYSFRFELDKREAAATVIVARAYIVSSDVSVVGLEEKASGVFTFVGVDFPWKAYGEPNHTEVGEDFTSTFTYTFTDFGITVAGETYYEPV